MSMLNYRKPATQQNRRSEYAYEKNYLPEGADIEPVNRLPGW